MVAPQAIGSGGHVSSADCAIAHTLPTGAAIDPPATADPALAPLPHTVPPLPAKAT